MISLIQCFEKRDVVVGTVGLGQVRSFIQCFETSDVVVGTVGLLRQG